MTEQASDQTRCVTPALTSCFQAETINKLLKRQAPKHKGRHGHLGGDGTPDIDAQRADPVLIRWISTKEGSRIAVPEEMLDGPTGKLFGGNPAGNYRGRKMVQEVS